MTTIQIGRRLIPIDQIALVELYNPGAALAIESTRKFEARVMLLNRESCLTETTVETFAKEHQFRMLEADRIALNPLIFYRVEQFQPTEDFKPEKPFQTRILWKDHRGSDQSKLLVASPEDVLATIANGHPRSSSTPTKLDGASARAGRGRVNRQRRPAHEL
ncbi:MAG: hypothetical protein WDN31_02935 [Hyphomicrobium sp.]